MWGPVSNVWSQEVYGPFLSVRVGRYGWSSKYVWEGEWALPSACLCVCDDVDCPYMVLRVALLGGTCRKCLEVRKKFCVALCALGSGRCGGSATKRAPVNGGCQFADRLAALWYQAHKNPPLRLTKTRGLCWVDTGGFLGVDRWVGVSVFCSSLLVKVREKFKIDEYTPLQVTDEDGVEVDEDVFPDLAIREIGFLISAKEYPEPLVGGEGMEEEEEDQAIAGPSVSDPEPLVGGEGMEEEEDQAIAGPSLSGTSHMDQERPGPSVTLEAFQRLEARLSSLERSHALLLNKWRPLQAAPAPVAPTSAQKGEHVGKVQNADFLYESLVEDYRLFRLGARTRTKDIDNAKQSASHSLRFCRYMAQGVPADCLTRSLRFLNRMDHLRGYPTYLVTKGYKSTTIKNMITNVIMFLRHVSKRFPRQTRLRPAEASNIEYELQRIQRDIAREVLVHRQKVLKKKSGYAKSSQILKASALAFCPGQPL
uniref:Uncharacterized protein n=1 Tax=Knipowitschia caucasica TaxID=637954 RepID=A0AAV2LDJ9_KNICA